MRRNKFIIPILIIFFICAGYYFYNSYGVNALGLSQRNITSENTNDTSSEKQKGKQGKKSDKASNKKDNLTGVSATPALTMTPVSEDGFSFAIQADSHLDQNTNTELYTQTLQNIVSEKPSFLIDLGDTFMSEKFSKTQEDVEARYVEAKSYFNTLGQIPLYLVTGNHEGENGWDGKTGQSNMLTWTREARLKYFPPAQTSLPSYSGNSLTANYYTFTNKDAQFIILDPFTYSTEKAKNDDDGWKYTLGKTQYDWLKTTLESSKAKYKFIFIHNLVGGYSKDARGGAEAAKFYEWGGYSSNGTYEFDKMRPDWGKPIHELLVDNKVTAVFHGHDHFYAKQNLDGIIYQLVPQPGTPGNSINSAAEYSYKDGVFLPSAGYLRVVVSDSKIVVEYIKTSLESNDNKNIPDSYTIYSK